MDPQPLVQIAKNVVVEEPQFLVVRRIMTNIFSLGMLSLDHQHDKINPFL